MKKENTIAILAGVILLMAVILTYANHFHNGFHFDDSHSVVDNIYIRDMKNWKRFFTDATTFSSMPTNQSYRPLLTLTFALDYWLGGKLEPFYFHLSNFLFYVLQLILMYFLFLKIFNLAYEHKWNTWLTLFAVGWYGLHTAHAETINYISARSDSLSTLFVIMAFILYIFSPLATQWYLYLIPMILGTLVKPTALMFAPLLFLYILFFEQEASLKETGGGGERETGGRGNIHLSPYPRVPQSPSSPRGEGVKMASPTSLPLFFREKGSERLPAPNDNLKGFLKTLIITLPAFATSIVLYIFQGVMTPPTFFPSLSPVFNYLISQPFVFLHYVRTFFLPTALSADTDWGVLQSIFDYRFFIGAAFVIGLLIIAFLTSKQRKTRPIAFGILWFFLALLPSSSIIPFSEVMNDHRIFFPFVGLMISVCWGIGLLVFSYEKAIISHRLAHRLASVSLLLAGALILFAHAYGTRQRNKVWRTEESLWYDVTVKSPKNGRGLMNYGCCFMRKGEYGKALSYFEKALVYCPFYGNLFINLAIVKNALERAPAEVEGDFRKAQVYGPNYPASYFFYAKWLNQQKRDTEAVPLLIKTLQLSPSFMQARYLLMDIYALGHRGEELLIMAKETLNIDSHDQLALIYLQALSQEQPDLVPLIEVVKKNPTPENYLNLSLSYYQERQFEKCIEAAKRVLKLKPDYVEAFNNIGCAYIMLGEYEKAIQACEKSIKLKPDFQLAKGNLQWAYRVKDLEKSKQSISTAEDFYGLGLGYYKEGLYEKCIWACNEAIKLKPDYAEAYNNLCAAYNSIGRWDEATAACEKALTIRPDFTLARNNLEYANREYANHECTNREYANREHANREYANRHSKAK